MKDSESQDMHDTNGFKKEEKEVIDNHHMNVAAEYGEEDEDNDDDQEFEKLLAPSPDYVNSHNDDDLDELMGIELNTIHHDNNRRRRNKSSNNINNSTSGNNKKCCMRHYGNTFILHTACYEQTNKKYGIMGPHYVGVVCTIGLLLFASTYFTKKAFETIGVQTGFVCIIFTMLSFWNLYNVTCVDPGIVKIEDQIVKRKKNIGGGSSSVNGDDDNNDEDEEEGGANGNEYIVSNIGEEKGWKFCRACDLYQPPKAAHCGDCNVCVDEYVSA
jgi:hypothetical protein